MPDVGLHVETAASDFRRARANGERFGSFAHEAKTGLAGMRRLDAGQELVERGALRDWHGLLRRQLRPGRE